MLVNGKYIRRTRKKNADDIIYFYRQCVFLWKILLLFSSFSLSECQTHWTGNKTKKWNSYQLYLCVYMLLLYSITLELLQIKNLCYTQQAKEFQVYHWASERERWMDDVDINSCSFYSFCCCWCCYCCCICLFFSHFLSAFFSSPHVFFADAFFLLVLFSVYKYFATVICCGDITTQPFNVLDRHTTCCSVAGFNSSSFFCKLPSSAAIVIITIKCMYFIVPPSLKPPLPFDNFA